MILEPIPFLAPPEITPFVLLDDDGWPLFQEYSNGMIFVAGYQSLRGAERGRRRWGGAIWNRLLRKWAK